MRRGNEQAIKVRKRSKARAFEQDTADDAHFIHSQFTLAVAKKLGMVEEVIEKIASVNKIYKHGTNEQTGEICLVPEYKFPELTQAIHALFTGKEGGRYE